MEVQMAQLREAKQVEIVELKAKVRLLEMKMEMNAAAGNGGGGQSSNSSSKPPEAIDGKKTAAAVDNNNNNQQQQQQLGANDNVIVFLDDVVRAQVRSNLF
jgi:hypothetical protein